MKIKNILFGLMFLLAGTSCTDQMDYREYTFYDKEYVFTDFGRTNGFVLDVYSALDYDLPSSSSLSSACDEAEYAWSWAGVHDYYNGSWGPLNHKSQWGYYEAIRAANYYLKECTNADYSEHRFDKDYESQMNRLKRYPYEVRLLRAYYYFQLVRAYGDVPFTTEVMSEKEANALSRTPASTIFDFIVSECDAVKNELPIDYTKLENDAANGTNPETGRVNRGTALALKARALLYQASPLFNASNNVELWKKAALASKDVIKFCTDNNIKLGKYSALWGTDNYKASEMIFVRRVGDMDAPERDSFPIGMENGNSGNCPTQNLVDAYEMKATGKAWNEEESGYNAANPYADRDPRFGMTIAVNGEKWPDTNPTPLQIYTGGLNALPIPGATPTGYYLKKYLDKTINISATNSSGGKRHSWITYRLGEFYLNYAEAVFKYLGSADAKSSEFEMSAREAVNVVRNREDVKMPDFSENMSSTDFWTKYQRERMVELAFEGHRFWDIRRWKEGDKLKSIVRMEITKNGSELTYKRVVRNRTWDDKMYLFPIPDSEQKKNPNLTQNPGWE